MHKNTKILLGRRRHLFTFILSLCLLLNFSAKALRVDERLSFSTSEIIRSSEILNAPLSEAPVPVVTIYLPRNDFASGKSKSAGDVGREFIKNDSQFISSDKFSFPSGIQFQVPVYLLNNVFRI
jgi:hypothetical protein